MTLDPMDLDEAVYQLASSMPEAFGEPVNGDYAVKKMTAMGHSNATAMALHTVDGSGQHWQITVRPVESVRPQHPARS